MHIRFCCAFLRFALCCSVYYGLISFNNLSTLDTFIEAFALINVACVHKLLVRVGWVGWGWYMCLFLEHTTLPEITSSSSVWYILTLQYMVAMGTRLVSNYIINIHSTGPDKVFITTIWLEVQAYWYHCDVTWSPRRFRLPTTGLLLQQLAQTNNKWESKLCILGPSWGEPMQHWSLA